MTRKKWLAVLVVAVIALAIVGAASGGSKAAPQSSTTSLSTVNSSTSSEPSTSADVAQAPTTLTASTESSAPSTSSTSFTSPTSTVVVTPSGLVQVHYIDVGQGDSILIVSPEGKVMLIDGGVAGSPALEYLSIKGIDHIDLMVATHPHADHIGGLVEVLSALKVSEVVTNGQPTTTKTYEDFLDGIAKAKAVYKEVKRGDKLALGSLTFDVLSPEGPGGDDLNEGSLVLRLVYGEVAFLFTGDAGHAAEAGMLAAGDDLQAQILKVGHHGSSSASSPEFLAAVKPEVTIYSCGVGNSYGHPDAETIANLTDTGASIYGTDVNGTVVVTSDGSTYQLKAERGEARGPPSATITQTTTSLSGPLAIDVVSLTSPASRGSTAKLTIKTAPGAACTITVYYKSGPSEAAGLGPQTASRDGTATWRWKVGARTTPGTWRIVVTAEAGGQQESAEIPFEVR